MIKTTFLQKNVNNLETLRLFHFFLTSANKPQSSLVLYCKFEVNHDRRTRWKKKNSLLDLPSHSYEPFAIGDKEKNKTIVIFFFTFIPKWQNSRVNVMNVKNGCLEVLESVTLFLLKTETCDAKNCWEFLVDAAFCFVKIILVSKKKEDKYKAKFDEWKPFNLPFIQHKVVLLVSQTVFAVGFWLLSFLQQRFGQEYSCK